MNFLQLVNTRNSTRTFSSVPVEREKIDYILQAAQLAPSAVNFQPWSFVVITNAQMMEKLHACYHRDWFKTAGTCIVAFGNHEQSWKRPKDGKDHCDIDVAIAVTHLMLAATEQGLGTCWIGNFDMEKCKEIFDCPAHIEPIALIPIGYPDENKVHEKQRKSMDDIVSRIE